MVVWLLASTLLLSTLGAPAIALAHPAVDAGVAAYEEADFERALALFEQAEAGDGMSAADLAILLELRFPPAALLGLGAFLFLAALVLLVLVPFVWGATPGMALADLRVAAADGGSPTLAASTLRFLGALLTTGLAGVPLLVAAFDRRGRTLSDLLSGTTLVPAR